MIDDIPIFVYDRFGCKVRVVKVVKIFFKEKQEYGYVFHVERAEKITTISEFDLEKRDGNYHIKKDILKEYIE